MPLLVSTVYRTRTHEELFIHRMLKIIYFRHKDAKKQSAHFRLSSSKDAILGLGRRKSEEILWLWSSIMLISIESIICRAVILLQYKDDHDFHLFRKVQLFSSQAMMGSSLLFGCGLVVLSPPSPPDTPALQGNHFPSPKEGLLIFHLLNLPSSSGGLRVS